MQTLRHGAFLFLALVAVVIIGLSELPKTAAAIVPGNPLIIIPTVLGTLPSEDGPVLDPIFHTYDNLIDTFVENGYEEGSTLFVLEYDWQQSAVESAQELDQLIEEVKSTCPGCTASTTVDIVGHGLGGLVAWHHIQSADYADDVDQLIWLGTPFAGVPAAYLAHEGGVFRIHSSPVGQGLGQALLNMQAQDGGYPTTFHYIAAEAPSFEELLPITLPDVAFEYLNGVTFPDDYPPNPFLENLWNNDISGDVNSMTTMMGLESTANTLLNIAVVPSTNPPLWPHGEPSGAFLDEDGDGVTSLFSIAQYLSPDFTYSAESHTSLPTAAQSDIFEILNGTTPSPIIANSYPVECLLFVSTTNDTNLQITSPSEDQLGKDFSTDGVLEDIPDSFYSGFEGENEYGIVVGPEVGLYEVQVEGEVSGIFTLTTTLACEDTTVTAASSEPIEPDEIVDLEVTIEEDGDVIVQPPPTPGDITAPLVTITNPVVGETYEQNEDVLVEATIVDDSPIATTTYLFNGDVINPAEPLPLLGAPLGVAEIVVSATDTAGNTGSSSVTFIIAPAPAPDTAPPVITITSPVSGQTYLSDNTSVFLTATVVDDSPIATTTYLFNGVTINPIDPLPFFDAPLGAANASVAATDAAGNSATATVSFIIEEPPPPPDSYTIEFLPPISAKCYIPSHKTGISKIWKYLFARLHLHQKFDHFVKRYLDCSDPAIFKAGSNVPVKFRVKNDEGQYVQLDGSIAWIEPVKGPTLNSPIDEMVYTEQPSTGYFYSWNGSHFQFNWKTSKSAKGYWYHLFVVLPDGSIHQTVLGLR